MLASSSEPTSGPDPLRFRLWRQDSAETHFQPSWCDPQTLIFHVFAIPCRNCHGIQVGLQLDSILGLRLAARRESSGVGCERLCPRAQGGRGPKLATQMVGRTSEFFHLCIRWNKGCSFVEIDRSRRWSQTLGRSWLTLASPKRFRSKTSGLSSKAEPSSFPCTSKLRECLDRLRSRNGFSGQVRIIWKVHSLTWPVNYVRETGVIICTTAYAELMSWYRIPVFQP